MRVQKEIKRETTVKETTIETFTESCCEKNNSGNIQELLEECQEYHYAQSSKFSQLSRSLVFGILGTIWILSYSEQGFTPNNNWQIWTLIVGFIYLAIDVCHYFCDSCFYRNEYFQFDKEKNIAEHNKRMNDRSRLSYCAIWGKFLVLFIVCSLFIVGFVKQFDVISKLF